MKDYPALDVRGADAEFVAAAADDFEPTAIEERDDSTRVFFATTDARDAARAALAARFHVTPVDVPDEDWARRSQQSLRPITVGRITVAPPWASGLRSAGGGLQTTVHDGPSGTSEITIVIQPSMGFGTGHHATTRLCLAALQTLDLSGKFVVDVGTGSGVLAIAAARLGAARALGIDNDVDAIQSARENVALNPQAHGIEFQAVDLAGAALPQADVVVANLTGALLVRAAATLTGAVRPGGVLIVSGLLAHERTQVLRAVSDTIYMVSYTVSDTCQTPGPLWEHEEDGWVALAVKKP